MYVWVRGGAVNVVVDKLGLVFAITLVVNRIRSLKSGVLGLGRVFDMWYGLIMGVLSGLGWVVFFEDEYFEGAINEKNYQGRLWISIREGEQGL